jgi:hypothetical protein
MFGGKPDAEQILIALPNGGQQLIPADWTDQVHHLQCPPGALFPFERLVVLRQRLDRLLAKDDGQAIITAKKEELDRLGGSDVNQRSANPLESIKSRTTCQDYCDPGSDVATPMDTGNGGAA